MFVVIPHRGSARGFTLIELALALFIAVILIFLLMPAWQSPRIATRRDYCRNNLKQISLALYNYHDAYGSFPPAYTVDADGKPLHSWRTLILPFIDQRPLYETIDLSKPWDDPANAEALKTAPIPYWCPSDEKRPQDHTSYLAIVTVNSAMRPTEPRKLSEITDGTDKTLMLIEAGPGQSVPWMSPRDADEAFLQGFTAVSNEIHARGRHAAKVDGSVRFLPQEIDRETFNAMVTATGGETVGDF